MPKFKITKTFAFAHRGCEVVQYEAGSEVETEDSDLIDTLLAEKWGHKAREARSVQPDQAADLAADLAAPIPS